MTSIQHCVLCGATQRSDYIRYKDHTLFKCHVIELIWAIKTFFSGKKKTGSNDMTLNTEIEKKSNNNESNGIKESIKKILHPVNFLVGKVGLGAELIALARKG